MRDHVARRPSPPSPTKGISDGLPTDEGRRPPPPRRWAFDYLQLVGPAVLAALAAVAVMVTVNDEGVPSFHIGVEWVAILACLGIVAWRRNLLLGLIVAIAIVSVTRAVGVAALP